MTAGPWGLRGKQIRAEGGTGRHVADYMVEVADGRVIAAAPEMLAILYQLIDIARHRPGPFALADLATEAEGLIKRIETREAWEE